MDKYFSGKELYGDGFSLEEINQWYQDEKEGYADLVSDQNKDYHYGYHLVNKIFGYKYLPQKKYKTALGVGSAYGIEFKPIISLIDHIFILEPSDKLVSQKIGDINLIYQKPNIDGTIDFPDDTFDLIICFDTLHHIPNVKYVLSELYRCLKKDGYFLLKEPINSMGDWREKREGLTKRERGIPLNYLKRNVTGLGFKIIRANLFFTMTSFLTRKTRKVLPKPIYEYKTYLIFDRFLSKLLKWNITYHPTTIFKRIAPSQVLMVLKK